MSFCIYESCKEWWDDGKGGVDQVMELRRRDGGIRNENSRCLAKR
jgi:hypothetical protein